VLSEPHSPAESFRKLVTGYHFEAEAIPVAPVPNNKVSHLEIRVDHGTPSQGIATQALHSTKEMMINEEQRSSLDDLEPLEAQFVPKPVSSQ